MENKHHQEISPELTAIFKTANEFLVKILAFNKNNGDDMIDQIHKVTFDIESINMIYKWDMKMKSLNLNNSEIQNQILPVETKIGFDNDKKNHDES